jgi:hypothetical protein
VGSRHLRFQHWPDLEDRFAAPLLDKVDLHADATPGSGKHLGISHGTALSWPTSH